MVSIVTRLLRYKRTKSAQRRAIQSRSDAAISIRIANQIYNDTCARVKSLPKKHIGVLRTLNQAHVFLMSSISFYKKSLDPDICGLSEEVYESIGKSYLKSSGCSKEALEKLGALTVRKKEAKKN